jgi:hypothetical protein
LPCCSWSPNYSVLVYYQVRQSLFVQVDQNGTSWCQRGQNWDYGQPGEPK